MRTRTLLSWALVVVVVFTAGRSILTVNTFNHLLATFATLTRQDDRVEATLNDVAAIAIDLDTGVRGWLLTGSATFQEPYRRQSRLWETVEALTELMADDPVGHALAARLRKELEVWNRDIAEPLLALDARRGLPADLLALNVEGKRRMDGIRDDIADLRSLSIRKREEHRRIVTGVREEIVRQTWMLSGALVALLAGIGIILTRQIERPLAMLVAHTEATAAIGLEGPVPEQGVSEVRALARALSSMSKRLSSERMREHRFTELLAALSAGGTVAAIADVALRALRTDQDAMAGVLWLGGDPGAALTVAASVHVDPDRVPAGGSALAREAYATGKLLQLDQIPGAAVHVLGAALIDVVPQTLLLARIEAAGTPVGVIELVGAARFRVDDLMASLPRVGLALQNAMSVERTLALQGQVVAVNDELSARNDELQAQEELLRVQRSELLSQRSELETRNQILVQASRLKSDFLSSMSHELRTPLNAVIGFSDLLVRGSYGEVSPEQASAVSDIAAAGRQLLALVNDILDLSKIEAGRLEVDVYPMDLNQVIVQALATIAPLADKKDLVVRGVPVTGTIDCLANEIRVQQVLVNLLANAVKFTPRGGIVAVSVVEGGAQVRVDVKDTGIGISAADRAQLFQPFTQVGARQVEGTGLGLSISRRLVELMHGTISVTSEPGQGSTFSFTLPRTGAVATLVAPGTGAPAATPIVSGPVSDGVTMSNDLPGPGEAHGSVLLIDDNEMNRRVVGALLRPVGYDVQEAANAEDGMEWAFAHRPDVILMDIRMPGIDGIEATEILASDRRTGGIPVIALSAQAMPGDRERALRAGCVAYVTKPIGRHELFGALAHARPKGP